MANASTSRPWARSTQSRLASSYVGANASECLSRVAYIPRSHVLFGTPRLSYSSPISLTPCDVRIYSSFRRKRRDNLKPYLDAIVNGTEPPLRGPMELSEWEHDDGRDGSDDEVEGDDQEEDLQAGRQDLKAHEKEEDSHCLLYTSPSPRDRTRSRMPSSA